MRSREDKWLGPEREDREQNARGQTIELKERLSESKNVITPPQLHTHTLMYESNAITLLRVECYGSHHRNQLHTPTTPVEQRYLSSSHHRPQLHTPTYQSNATTYHRTAGGNSTHTTTPPTCQSAVPMSRQRLAFSLRGTGVVGRPGRKDGVPI